MRPTRATAARAAERLPRARTRPGQACDCDCRGAGLRKFDEGLFARRRDAAELEEQRARRAALAAGGRGEAVHAAERAAAAAALADAVRGGAWDKMMHSRLARLLKHDFERRQAPLRLVQRPCVPAAAASGTGTAAARRLQAPDPLPRSFSNKRAGGAGRFQEVCARLTAQERPLPRVCNGGGRLHSAGAGAGAGELAPPRSRRDRSP